MLPTDSRKKLAPTCCLLTTAQDYRCGSFIAEDERCGSLHTPLLDKSQQFESKADSTAVIGCGFVLHVVIEQTCVYTFSVLLDGATNYHHHSEGSSVVIFCYFSVSFWVLLGPWGTQGPSRHPFREHGRKNDEKHGQRTHFCVVFSAIGDPIWRHFRDRNEKEETIGRFLQRPERQKRQ